MKSELLISEDMYFSKKVCPKSCLLLLNILICRGFSNVISATMLAKISIKDLKHLQRKEVLSFRILFCFYILVILSFLFNVESIFFVIPC
jgi:hypothetical protein